MIISQNLDILIYIILACLVIILITWLSDNDEDKPTFKELCYGVLLLVLGIIIMFEVVFLMYQLINYLVN